MKQVSIRQVIAAAGATAMAGAALVVGGAGVASAQDARAYDRYTGLVSTTNMDFERIVSPNSVTYGDTVTVLSRIIDSRGGWVGNTHSWIEDVTPDCMEYVPGTARWKAWRGDWETPSSRPGEFAPPSATTVRAQFSPRVSDPLELEAQYIVKCDAANSVGTGGMAWNGTLRSSDSSSRSMGPTINVKRLSTSVFLANPVNPQVNQQLTFNVITENVPDGSEVAFTIDGVPAGVAVVNNNQAALPYTPTNAGNIVVRASFGQNGTHGGSAYTRTVTVSRANVDSTVTVEAAAGAKVGLATQLTAAVSPAEAGGTVSFRDHNAEIGSAPVGADGTATIEWIPQTAGDRTIDADFSGRTGVNSSSGATNVMVAQADPDAVPTTTTLAEISNARVGEQIALSATVGGDVTGGTVSFYDGSTLIGTSGVNGSGQATVNWTPSTDGDRTIRVVYSGHEEFLSSQTSPQVFVAPVLVDPEPDPDPEPTPTDPDTGSLGSLTGSGDAGNTGGSLGSLSNFGS
ncbi:Ig-like domain-containing protein [Dietzia sp. NPDC055343]